MNFRQTYKEMQSHDGEKDKIILPSTFCIVFLQASTLIKGVCGSCNTIKIDKEGNFFYFCTIIEIKTRIEKYRKMAGRKPSLRVIFSWIWVLY